MLPPPAGQSEPARTPWPWIVACAALTVALLSSALWWRSVRLLDDLTTEVAQLRAHASLLAAVPPVVTSAPPPRAPAEAAAPAAAPAAEIRPLVVPVPYGADTFGGARYDLIRQFLFRLVRQKVTGVAEVRTFAGRFCLVGSPGEGYSLAPEDVAFSKCDLVGNPSEEGSSAAQRTPLALANLIGEIRSTTHGGLDVQLAGGDPANLVTAYPMPSAELTAGEWNRVASSNNRVEIRVR
jgi:hypothetical protein